MITGFGNNTVSALASDITATQTTFSVVPGAGEKFAELLTTDISNPSSPHQIYAKLTLTDSQGTVFEICHLTNVSGDTLTALRGQEGTTAKGWSLNDVVSNFATRGSEECFVQIEQLQAGDYTSATAGGTPNGLTVSLPSTFLNNASSDWLLKTPLMVTPIAANSGPTTIQVTLAGKVMGTFPAYKGNKAELGAGDLLANIPFICVMDSTKTFFTVINPAQIYSKLGGAAYLDVGITSGTVAAGDDSRITGAAQKSKNLSDLSSSSDARTNLGLGPAALRFVGTGANQLPDMNAFTSSISQNGWFKLPNGIIFQWGASSPATTANPDVLVNFPIPFPNVVLAIGEHDRGGSTAMSFWQINNLAQSGFYASAIGSMQRGNIQVGPVPQSAGCQWWAWGY